MKLIATIQGRVLQVYNPDEARGAQDFHWPTVAMRLKERYAFQKHSELSTASQSGLSFESGRLPTEGHEVSIKEMVIYNDGILVVARDTASADIALNDAVAWASDALNLRLPETSPPRLYTSMVIVEFEKQIASLFDQFEGLKRLLGDAFEAAHNKSADFDVRRLSFNVDPLSAPQIINSEFLFERRINEPYEKDRFFCSGPLQTHDHLNLLGRFEGLMSPANSPP